MGGIFVSSFSRTTTLHTIVVLFILWLDIQLLSPCLTVERPKSITTVPKFLGFLKITKSGSLWPVPGIGTFETTRRSHLKIQNSWPAYRSRLVTSCQTAPRWLCQTGRCCSCWNSFVHCKCSVDMGGRSSHWCRFPLGSPILKSGKNEPKLIVFTRFHLLWQLFGDISPPSTFQHFSARHFGDFCINLHLRCFQSFKCHQMLCYPVYQHVVGTKIGPIHSRFQEFTRVLECSLHTAVIWQITSILRRVFREIQWRSD